MPSRLVESMCSGLFFYIYIYNYFTSNVSFCFLLLCFCIAHFSFHVPFYFYVNYIFVLNWLLSIHCVLKKDRKEITYAGNNLIISFFPHTAVMCLGYILLGDKFEQTNVRRNWVLNNKSIKCVFFSSSF